MTDIDFDELDKAVNNLMGKVGNERTDDTPEEKTFTVSSTLGPGEKPEYEKIGEVASKIGSETLIGQGERTTVEDLHSEVQPPAADEQAVVTPVASPPVDTPPIVTETVEPTPPIASTTPAPAPAVRRPSSGRFMDVVHPSSDMKSPASSSALEVPARVVQQPAAPITTAAPSESKQSGAPVLPQDTAPLTPFLPDAKVEKRPLGEPVPPTGPSPVEEKQEIKTEDDNAASERDLSEDDLDGEFKPVKDAADNQQPVDATSVVGPLTVEEKQLQAVESNQTNGTTEPPAISISAVESGDTESLNAGTVKALTPQPATEKEAATGDVYSVKTDQQPLGHPAKQKSGWGTVIVIIVIIIVFAALGAGAYFMLNMSA